MRRICGIQNIAADPFVNLRFSSTERKQRPHIVNHWHQHTDARRMDGGKRQNSTPIRFFVNVKPTI